MLVLSGDVERKDIPGPQPFHVRVQRARSRSSITALFTVQKALNLDNHLIKWLFLGKNLEHRTERRKVQIREFHYSIVNGCIEGANQTIQGQIRVIKDYTDRQIGATIGLDSSVLKWLVRHAAWTLTTFHVGGDGMTVQPRIRGKPFNQQIAAFGEQILFKPHKTAGPQQKLAVNWLGRFLARFQHEDGEHIFGAVPQHSEVKQRRALEP